MFTPIYTQITKITINIIFSRVGIVSILALYFYFSYTSKTSTIEKLEQQLEEQVKINQDTEFRFIRQLKICKTRIDEQNKSNENLDILHKKIERPNKKSISELADKKTSLVQKNINKAINNVIDCFMKISEDKQC